MGLRSASTAALIFFAPATAAADLSGPRARPVRIILRWVEADQARSVVATLFRVHAEADSKTNSLVLRGNPECVRQALEVIRLVESAEQVRASEDGPFFRRSTPADPEMLESTRRMMRDLDRARN